MKTLSRAVLLAAAVSLGLAGCSAPEKAEPARPVSNLEVRAESDATAEVQRHADDIADIIETPLEKPQVRPISCRPEAGKTTELGYSVQGVYQLGLERVSDPVGTLEVIKMFWKELDYQVPIDKTVGSRRTMRALTPDGYTVDLQTNFPKALRVTVYSACFSRPAPGPSSS
ncbi:hypothetical protein AMIS_29560 [Actinoplanes missouriensis 431]|uniref:Lipoprotein n=1 Tax=Actinoplanes missouriensis (strain ATCC 14538 / DSM 43046 / CBS 188.64 / JCM 3121 / NBRC 102363 / NCIMB 12654 / NRRL B-3342 / UNCC 431) TaxID=512565 RepID=I0H589_ACTM4|nr:hypothetical protein [Actinoplanes missouriensis]BAL88176.1 hypothetical protein AMIS_29560 [Actinoplanes missouriensis 431]